MRHSRPVSTWLLSRLLWYAVVALGAAFLALATAQASDIAAALQWHPDASIPWVLTLTPDAAGPRNVVDGSYGFWSVLWFDGLTQSLSFHRVLWVAQPLALWLATAALLGYAVYRVAGATAAMAITVILTLGSEAVMDVVLIPTMHGQTVFAGAVLAAFAVELTRPRPFGGPRRLIAAGVVVALVAGVHLADAQLWVIGIVPLLVAVGAWWAGARDEASRRGLLAAIAVAVGAVVVWLVAGAIMRAAGVRELAPDTTSAIDGPGELWPHVRALFDMVLWLGNGALELSTAGLGRGVLSLACAGVMVAGVALAPVLLVLALVRRRPEPIRLVHLVFWSVVVGGLVAAVILTNLAEQPSTRYVISLLLALAVTVPLLPRVAALTATIVLLAGATVALADRDLADVGRDARATLASIERAAQASGARTGFGDYYLASNVTWGTHGRVVSRPVISWATPVCPFDVAIDRAWFRPTGSHRTFVLWPTATPPNGLGTPMRTIPIEGGATMFVYGGDVAERLCR